MDIVYARDPFPTNGHSSIFLAGPTPRAEDVPSWRPEALRLLQELGYTGTVFTPEPRDGQWAANYDTQVDWEDEGLNRADVILFWVPRDMATMPAFTTNDEWGGWKASGKVVFGAPPAAPSVRYQRSYATRYGAPQATTLEGTIQAALGRLKELGAPAPRAGAELTVPAHVWSTSAFQGWYKSLKAAGNRLEGARVEYGFWVGRPPGKLFLWALKAHVYITAEGRSKTNEIVLGRPDVSTVVLFGPPHPTEPLMTEVVVVREFRTPVNNSRGMVTEPPSGSSKTDRDPRVTAAEEVSEETGFHLAPERLEYLGARQLAATLSCHRSHLYGAELTSSEIAQVRSGSGEARGVAEDTERTYTEVISLNDLGKRDDLDWSAVGQIIYGALKSWGGFQ